MVDPNHMKPEIFSSMMKQNALRSRGGDPDSPIRGQLNLTTQNSVDSKDSYNSKPLSPRTERKQNMLKPMFGKAKSQHKHRTLKPVVPLSGAIQDIAIASNLKAENEL